MLECPKIANRLLEFVCLQTQQTRNSGSKAFKFESCIDKQKVFEFYRNHSKKGKNGKQACYSGKL